MQSIVHIQKNDLIVSIQDMADFSGNDYKSVQSLIRKYKEDFLEVGLDTLSVREKSGDFKSLDLNEPQATLLITFMKNNPTVRKFKVALVKEFYRMREQLCEVNRIQLETAHSEIKQLTIKRMKTYKDGFMSLNKYLKEKNINLTNETAWSMLVKYDIVEHRDVLTSKVFLMDETFGRQTGDSVIEFNSRSLDLIFNEYIHTQPDLFSL